MVTINPADCPPDLVYMGIVNGRREVMCRFPHRELPWETFANVHADDSVSDLVPLVEARPITRDEQGEMWARIRDELRKHYGAVTDADHRLLDLAASASADAAVEYLNDRGGLGIDTREPLERALRERDSLRCDLDWARGKCDELRSLIDGQKANVTKAQRERDEADRRTAEAEADRDRWKRHHDRVDGQWTKAEREVTRLTLALERVEAERDAAVERADRAEADLSAGRARVEVAENAYRKLSGGEDPALAVDRDVVEAVLAEGLHRGLTVDQLTRNVCAMIDAPLGSPKHTPAVSRADIEKAVDTGVRGTTDGDLIDPDADLPAGECARLAINAVWALVSGDDPAVYVVRESEVAAVPLKHDRNGWDVGQTWYPPLSRGEVKDLLAKEKRAMVRTLAIARAIGVEAEQSVDPVEEKAEELMRVLASETEDRTWGILTEPAREDFRRLARHVLGQEADQ